MDDNPGAMYLRRSTQCQALSGDWLALDAVGSLASKCAPSPRTSSGPCRHRSCRRSSAPSTLTCLPPAPALRRIWLVPGPFLFLAGWPWVCAATAEHQAACWRRAGGRDAREGDLVLLGLPSDAVRSTRRPGLVMTTDCVFYISGRPDAVQRPSSCRPTVTRQPSDSHPTTAHMEKICKRQSVSQMIERSILSKKS